MTAKRRAGRLVNPQSMFARRVLLIWLRKACVFPVPVEHVMSPTPVTMALPVELADVARWVYTPVSAGESAGAGLQEAGWCAAAVKRRRASGVAEPSAGGQVFGVGAGESEDGMIGDPDGEHGDVGEVVQATTSSWRTLPRSWYSSTMR
ncbi:hypothetical protein ACFWHV_21835 [Streptomyces collinus]|uniref:hypothetical protein n=1 Tax=Streptomyces collinus TaxID=42684 RepID=UPI00365629EA